MEKFSKLKPKNEFTEPDDEILYQDDKIKVVKYEDWSLIKEKDGPQTPCACRYIVLSKEPRSKSSQHHSK